MCKCVVLPQVAVTVCVHAHVTLIRQCLRVGKADVGARGMTRLGSFHRVTGGVEDLPCQAQG